MTAELCDVKRSRKILKICDVAVTLVGAERRAFLENSCGKDYELLEEVRSLLDAIDRSGRFLSLDLELPTE